MQRPERQRHRQPEQQQVQRPAQQRREQERERPQERVQGLQPLLFYRRQTEQQQTTKLRERETCSFLMTY